MTLSETDMLAVDLQPQPQDNAESVIQPRMTDRYESARDSAVVQEELSVLRPPDAASLPENGAALVTVAPPTDALTEDMSDEVEETTARPLALRDRRIPSRNPTVRRRVVELYVECSWLTAADLHAVTRWSHLSVRFAKMAETLDRLPVVKVGTGGKDAEPRRLDRELREVSREMSRIEAALGVTAAARYAMGVSITQLQDMSQLFAAKAKEEVH